MIRSFDSGWWMNFGFSSANNAGELLDRHVVLRGLRIRRSERLGDEIAGVLDQRERLR